MANSHEREPRRLSVVDRRMLRACSAGVLVLCRAADDDCEFDARTSGVVSSLGASSASMEGGRCIVIMLMFRRTAGSFLLMI